MIKAVIFDMDGLMIDSERVTFEGYQKILVDYNQTITIDFYKTLLGNPVQTIQNLFYKEYGNDFPIVEIMERVHIYMDETFKNIGVPLKDGLVPLLQYLKSRSIKTIVATSSQRKRVDMILQSANLEMYFDDSICGDEVTNGKPHPEIFLKACQKLNVDVKDAIVLEDSIQGIQAAYDGNIDVYCIPDMKVPEENYQDKTKGILNSLHEIIHIIESSSIV